ncbi:phosphatidate cytidylyltransferase [Mucilaginibacter psychrotolerans]|uniref:Phosphatidate cytidylyltransferase n=1 Tax=Mucilaginibacter psychrotolerans TaxID=1524096 RepID=A0A4Y8SP00_9SPHI|nr:phosphatidate cytidylyltransferase [Mucilaginibacter psychrotolerans]TFF40174.1 phosphatidate cytidylyltransferase [Mucilaginibacter psychrotolerans]
MKTRAITGFFFIIVMLGSVMLSDYVFGGFYLLLCLLCLHEFYGLNIKSGIQPNRLAGFITAILVFSGFALINYSSLSVLPATETTLVWGHRLLFLLPISVSAIFIHELFKIDASPFTNIAYTILGIVLICIPFSFFIALAYVKLPGSTGVHSLHIPLGFLLMLWSNDTGAYLVGRAIGRTKLFERHSPKKTWEGFIGGVLIAALVGFIISLYFKDLPWNQWVSIAIIISCFGTLGDLVESMFKRSINIKDSGGILPGHGGLLDRFDGFLIAAPVVYTYLYFAVNV